MSPSNCEFHESRCYETSINLAAQNEFFHIPTVLHIFRTIHTVDTLVMLFSDHVIRKNLHSESK